MASVRLAYSVVCILYSFLVSRSASSRLQLFKSNENIDLNGGSHRLRPCAIAMAAMAAPAVPAVSWSSRMPSPQSPPWAASLWNINMTRNIISRDSRRRGNTKYYPAGSYGDSVLLLALIFCPWRQPAARDYTHAIHGDKLPARRIAISLLHRKNSS